MVLLLVGKQGNKDDDFNLYTFTVFKYKALVSVRTFINVMYIK